MQKKIMFFRKKTGFICKMQKTGFIQGKKSAYFDIIQTSLPLGIFLQKLCQSIAQIVEFRLIQKSGISE